jgi:hypothetical protein
VKTRELGKLLGCMGMSDLYGAGDEAESIRHVWNLFHGARRQATIT